jgi:hypothetical protein
MSFFNPGDIDELNSESHSQISKTVMLKTCLIRQPNLVSNSLVLSGIQPVGIIIRFCDNTLNRGSPVIEDFPTTLIKSRQPVDPEGHTKEADDDKRKEQTDHRTSALASMDSSAQTNSPIGRP